MPAATTATSRASLSPSPRRGPGHTSHTARRSASRRDQPQTAADRDALLASHVGLVHHVARQLLRRLSTEAELDDLVSAGAIGLVQAADAFDARRGLSFSTFAVPRIRGAMLDELRRQDHASRGVRRRMRELSRARDELAARLERAPSLAELARHLQVTVGQVRQMELDAEIDAIASLDQPLRDTRDAATMADAVCDDAMPLDELLARESDVALLRAAIARLGEQERTVLALCYFEELKLREIAQVLGLSVCRISQIRASALAKLRDRLSVLRAA